MRRVSVSAGNGGQVPVDGGPRNAEGLGDLGGAFTLGTPGGRGGNLVRVHRRGATADAALGPSSCQAGHGAFMQHVSLQLDKRGHHREEELPFTTRCVRACQASRQDPQTNTTVVQIISQGEDLFD